MTGKQAEDMAKAILEAHHRRLPFVDLPAERIGHVAFAYAVQDRLVALRREAGEGDIFGWKIGMTTSHMQELTGVSEPSSGAILARRARTSGVQLRGSEMMHLGLEGEIAVRVGETFPETDPVSPGRAFGRLEAIAAGLEITDDRNADWTRLEAASLVADNIWNMGVVLGPPAPANGFGSLLGRRGVLTINGKVHEERMSDDVGCDPLLLVAWLGAHLARRGKPLQPGQWIMTGSFVSTTFPEAGDRYDFAVDGLDPVRASIV